MAAVLLLCLHRHVTRLKQFWRGKCCKCSGPELVPPRNSLLSATAQGDWHRAWNCGIATAVGRASFSTIAWSNKIDSSKDVPVESILIISLYRLRASPYHRGDFRRRAASGNPTSSHHHTSLSTLGTSPLGKWGIFEHYPDLDSAMGSFLSQTCPFKLA